MPVLRLALEFLQLIHTHALDQQEKVESFPFNVTSNPMYYGSTLSFLATALWWVNKIFPRICGEPFRRSLHRLDDRYESPSGLLLTVLVFVEYKVALLFEE